MSKEIEALDFVLEHAEFNDETPNKDLMDALNEIHSALTRLSAIESGETLVKHLDNANADQKILDELSETKKLLLEAQQENKRLRDIAYLRYMSGKTETELAELKKNVKDLLSALDLSEEIDTCDVDDRPVSFMFLSSGKEENCYINSEETILLIKKLQQLCERWKNERDIIQR